MALDLAANRPVRRSCRCRTTMRTRSSALCYERLQKIPLRFHTYWNTVLCGSRKYPLKEPFVELLKGSMHTFLNAFTYPYRTCYPVASMNSKDFYNLVDVYLDAVFFPKCVEDFQTFQQEG